MMQLTYQTEKLEAGCDEAGRGCLAGPVVAAAVILPNDFTSEILTDSKKLSPTQREKLRPYIEEKSLSYAVAMVMPEEIDEINILNASILAMHKAIGQLKTTPAFLAIDGNKFHSYKKIPHVCCVKGDGKFLNIAAASVLAKTYRDDYMKKIHQEYPMYDWQQNKGYPTTYHRAAIAEHGDTPYHRKSFRLIPTQFSLDL